ncbi:cbb3-type cytochrome oxidase assembly protein CcoS [Fibrella aquatica]|jgi:cbb3-type cytochrome oxidase maturation protein|uniref:cbb3-type cytochrome oxidase assembly protein CcoS n=1 Tax=Fibrella aquatica TaxID=3242487 RepID=UPI00352236FB
MSIIYFMIGVSLLMALGFLAAFIWSMRTGQQDDLYTPSMRMLLDDTTPYTTANQAGDPINSTTPRPTGLSANTTISSPTA